MLVACTGDLLGDRCCGAALRSHGAFELPARARGCAACWGSWCGGSAANICRVSPNAAYPTLLLTVAGFAASWGFRFSRSLVELEEEVGFVRLEGLALVLLSSPLSSSPFVRLPTRSHMAVCVMRVGGRGAGVSAYVNHVFVCNTKSIGGCGMETECGDEGISMRRGHLSSKWFKSRFLVWVSFFFERLSILLRRTDIARARSDDIIRGCDLGVSSSRCFDAPKQPMCEWEPHNDSNSCKRTATDRREVRDRKSMGKSTYLMCTAVIHRRRDQSAGGWRANSPSSRTRCRWHALW